MVSIIQLAFCVMLLIFLFISNGICDNDIGLNICIVQHHVSLCCNWVISNQQQYAPCSIKRSNFIFDYNSFIFWSIFIIFVPLETGMNTP